MEVKHAWLIASFINRPFLGHPPSFERAKSAFKLRAEKGAAGLVPVWVVKTIGHSSISFL